MEASKFPEIVATTYRAMYAHAMHLQIKTTEEEKLFCDRAIIASVWCQNMAIKALTLDCWRAWNTLTRSRRFWS